jgi:NDP-sugar pyrophosphorylase family protein
MKAVLLAGGQGTRLRPYTTIIPKPLVPVGDQPIMELILRRLHASGVNHVDVSLGYHGELIQAYFEHAAQLPADLELAWHWEGSTPLGTAGALRTVPDLDETFIALNGDVLTSLDFRDLVNFHRERQATLTVAMRAQTVAIDLGVIDSSDGRVTGYREKPSLHYDVSMGIYVYEPRALNYIPDQPFQFPELVVALIAAGEPVGAYRTDAEWYDVGTFGELERATDAVAAHAELFT